MSYNRRSLYSPSLEQAIDRHPLAVTPDAPLGLVLALMTEYQNSGPWPSVYPSLNMGQFKETYTSSVLIVAPPPETNSYLAPYRPSIPSTLLGQFTNRDLLSFIIADQPWLKTDKSWKNLPIGNLMSPAEITLTESNEQEVLTILSLLYQNQIRLLSLVDEVGNLTGVIASHRLRQILQPSNILKMRRVSELMSIPITAPPHTSLSDLAQLMLEQQVDCIVITEMKEVIKNQPQSNYTSVVRHSFLNPIGLVTADDLVQAQFLDINLAQVMAREVMSTQLFLINPNDSLWIVHQTMQRHQTSRLLVVGEVGELLGFVNENLLLQALDPASMYRVVKQLQQSVYKLQGEKLELLSNRNAELEKQVKERTAKLEEQLQRDHLLAKITSRIHQSLNLDKILNAAVDEVRRYLQTDRVVIYQLQLNGTASVIAEAVILSKSSMLGTVLTKETMQYYIKGTQPSGIYFHANCKQPDLGYEARTILQDLQIEASAIVPILLDGQLWGMMSAINCDRPRQWQPEEIDLLQQLATQIAIAIQQSLLYQQVQNLNADLEKQVQERTVELQQKIQELKQLNQVKDEFLSIVSHELRTPLTNMKMAIHNMIKLDPTPEQRQRYLKILESHCTKEIELINDLLDVQKLEAGAYTINFETVNLSNLLPTLIEPFKSRIQDRQQIFTVDYADNLPVITSNRNVLSQVLSELLNNACKYTRNGGAIIFAVKIGYGKSKQGQKNHGDSYAARQRYRVIFEIRNQTEIPQDELPKIFDKFYRIPNADPWKQGGTGLGLALVEKLVDQLGGTIEVNSADGWTNFTISLPKITLIDVD